MGTSVLHSAGAPALLACLSLAACSTPGPANPHTAGPPAAQAALIGLAKPALLACAGAPWRSGTHEGREYLIYLSGTPPDISAPRQAAAPTPAPAKRPADYCRVTFVMKDGVVEKITLAGYTRAPLVESPECARITDPCLKK